MSAHSYAIESAVRAIRARALALPPGSYARRELEEAAVAVSRLAPSSVPPNETTLMRAGAQAVRDACIALYGREPDPIEVARRAHVCRVIGAGAHRILSTEGDR